MPGVASRWVCVILCGFTPGSVCFCVAHTRGLCVSVWRSRGVRLALGLVAQHVQQRVERVQEGVQAQLYTVTLHNNVTI